MNKKLGGKRIKYDDLQTMKYLDQVISEVLRKWPTGILLDRICTKDCTIDIGDGKQIKIDKGSYMKVPAVGIHRDPKYYPDPEKFDPERFSDENRDRLIPGTYIPFGLGPRNCIGKLIL